jgi:hypothetical protein
MGSFCSAPYADVRIRAKDRYQSSAVPEAVYGQEDPFPSPAGVSKGWSLLMLAIVHSSEPIWYDVDHTF